MSKELSSSIVLLLVVLQMKCIVTNKCESDDGNNKIQITNISNTAVLVSWESTAQPSNIVYEVTYRQTALAASTLNIYTNKTSIILVNWESNTRYCVRIRSNNVCYSKEHTIQKINIENQVTNVRAHVYYPQLNNFNTISAQVIWETLPQSVNTSSYQVYVYSDDAEKINISGSPFNITPNDPFLRIELRNETNELSFPLAVNSRYIVQVRGITDNKMLPFSEPIAINISSIGTTRELFAVINGVGRVFFKPPGSNELLNESTGLIQNPIAINKRERSVFYIRTNTNVIMKVDIDVPVNRNQFFSLSDITPFGMTYDWIAKELYIAARDNNNTVIIYSIPDRELNKTIEVVRNTNRSYSQPAIPTKMTINPFTRLLHWNEGGQIYQLNLRNGSEDVLEDTQGSIAFSEDVLRNCLYYLSNTNQIRSMPLQQSNSNCFSISQNLQQNTISNPTSLSVDDNGIYFSGRISRNDEDKACGIIYYMYNGSITPLLTRSTQLSAIIESTSPGTQPLPADLTCLSLDFSENNNRPNPTIVSNTSTSVFIEWSVPNNRNDDCKSIVPSIQSLTYRVYVTTSSGNPLEGYNPKIIYNTSLNITGLMNGSYSIRVSARNDFTIGLPQDLVGEPLNVQIGNVQPNTVLSTTARTTSVSHTSSSQVPQTSSLSMSSSPTTFILSSSFPSLSSSSLFSTFTHSEISLSSTVLSPIPTVVATIRPTGTPNSLSVELIGGISGAVVAIMLLMGLIIIILLVVICVMKRRGSASLKTPVGDQTRYVRAPENQGPTDQVTTNFQTTLPQPYAIPADSLNEYRNQMATAQDYEVPSSLTMTDPKETNQSTSHYATVQQQQPPPYMALYPPNVDEPSCYSELSTSGQPNTYSDPVSIRQPSPYSDPVTIRQPSPYSDPVTIRQPSPYSEPVSTTGISPLAKPAVNQQLLSSVSNSYEQPIQLNGGTGVENHYFILENPNNNKSVIDSSGIDNRIYYHSENEQKENGEVLNNGAQQPLYFELERQANQENNSEDQEVYATVDDYQ